MSDFFKQSSRWVRADFHLHTAAAEDSTNEELIGVNDSNQIVGCSIDNAK